ncbi:MAG: GspH/FimT family pseudopilin [Gammaproteobacteria bacterium]|nr:GspH/FimT family pseudopilin [Gammaproteobacteria bacterium]
MLNGALRSRGVTLPELLIVLTILGVAAAVAIPSLSSSNPQTLDLAAEEFANAMRFARSEALRTGEPRGFRQKSSNKRIRVFRLDTATAPWTPNYDVYHPVSKQLYDIDLNSHPFAAADNLTHNRTYRGSCNKPGNVYFDSSGIPRCADPETVLLEQFDVTLTLGPHSRVVTLHGITGRVTVQ